MVRRTTTTTPLERRRELILATDVEERAISSRIALTLIRAL